jgi:hypothetical protein
VLGDNIQIYLKEAEYENIQVLTAVSREHGGKLSDFINTGEFLDLLADYQTTKKVSGVSERMTTGGATNAGRLLQQLHDMACRLVTVGEAR